MFRRIVLTVLLMIIAGFSCFGQTSALRDYVGMISQAFHPDIVSYLEKFRSDLDKRGYNAAAKGIENYLKGNSGTGFVYVAVDGKNYIITNYHVISQAQTLTVTFEKVDGEQTKFSGLTIVAADVDRDIALLTFAGGQNPFKEGMAFINRQAQEGDDVYSAGFPGLGQAMIWQLGRGMISNASVRIPADDDTGKVLGPFIQHTAQIDPGNSGGPLMVQTQGVPTGYAVAGINTLSYRWRQAANYAIPVSQVQAFLDASFKAPPDDQRPLLDTQITAFIEGLKAPKAAYPHISKYLSNNCTAENADYAISELIEKAPRTVVDDIATAFGYSPVNGMTYAVAWTIENALRSREGKIAIAVDTVAPNGANGFTVGFKVNNRVLSSEWINEYGIWRIRNFGDFAAGDKSLIKKKTEKKEADKRLRANPDVQIGAFFTYILDRGPAGSADITLRSEWLAYGVQATVTKNFFQGEGFYGLYFPIKAGPVAFTPYGNVGFGMQSKQVETEDNDYRGSTETKPLRIFDMGFSFEAGLQFTAAAVPGLYITAAYQYNLYLFSGITDEEITGGNDPHLIFAGIGYSF